MFVKTVDPVTAVIIYIDKDGKTHETNIKDLKVEHKPSDWKPILIEGKARFKLYNNKEQLH